MNRYRGEIKAVNLNCIKKKVTVTLEFTNDHNAIVDEDALARLADNPVFVSFESAQEQLFDDRTGPKDESQTELLDEDQGTDADFDVVEEEEKVV